MRFILNGRSVDIRPRPGASVLELLREDCGLRSMKDGCAPEGSCGACTVMVDGRAVVSCAQPATRVSGRTILTVEGLPPGARGAVTSTPSRTRLGSTPISLATRSTSSSPVSTSGAVLGLVPGVETGVPDTEVAWPRNSSALAV